MNKTKQTKIIEEYAKISHQAWAEYDKTKWKSSYEKVIIDWLITLKFIL